MCNKNWKENYIWISALQKAIRWCEVNDARYFARKLIDMGTPGAVLNRLIKIAAEDIGLADPTLLKYVRNCFDDFEDLLKKYNITRRQVCGFPQILSVIDRGVIAAALSYKSRLLAMLSFATLFDIYKRENFSEDLAEYERRFRNAIWRQDEKEAAYYAYVLGLFLDSEASVFKIIQQESRTRNTELIAEWTREYKKTKERLVLVGTISLLCRDLNYSHGEYRNCVSAYLSLPIKNATIPDRAYDMHTGVGKRKGRGLEHFFGEPSSVKKERFPNDYEEIGKNACFKAEKEKLLKSKDMVKAIQEKVKDVRKQHKGSFRQSTLSI